MPNGRPGDHPLTDFLVHGYEVFPEPIAGLMRQIHALDPHAFSHEDTRFQDTWEEGIRHHGDVMAWADGRCIAEGTAFLERKLALAKVMRTIRCPAADWVASEVIRTFAVLQPKTSDLRRTYPLDNPNPELRGVRVEYDLIWLSEGYGPDNVHLSVYTYPEPEIYLLNSQIKRFRSGDAQSVCTFLGEIFSGKRRLVTVDYLFRQIGAAAVESRDHESQTATGPVLKVHQWQSSLG